MKTEKALISEVATLYYKKNLTQQEIAEALMLGCMGEICLKRNLYVVLET